MASNYRQNGIICIVSIRVSRDMMQHFAHILVMVSSAKLLHALEQCQVQSLSVYGHHLASHVISTRASSGLIECVMMCSDESRCKSLNFRVNDKSCDLNDADRFTHPEDYGPKHGIVYMDASVKHRKVSCAACFDFADINNLLVHIT